MIRPRSVPPRSVTARLLPALLLAGCASTAEQDVPPPEVARPVSDRPLPDAELGKYLADLSNSITAWVQKTWSASTAEDERKQDLLELSIMERAHRRKADLVRELETGPVQNRIVAAAALGFTRDPAALSPLLAALHDPSDKVRNNALLGLTMLESTDTPPGEISEILATAPDSRLRWSAAYCLRTLAEAGVDDQAMRRAGRLALDDAEPMVRAQAALLLAQLGDAESLQEMAALLYDPFPLVAAAATRGIATIGRRDPEQKGRAVRALVQAMDEGDRELRSRILPDLVQLSGHNYELDVARWKEWAAKLP